MKADNSDDENINKLISRVTLELISSSTVVVNAKWGFVDYKCLFDLESFFFFNIKKST